MSVISWIRKKRKLNSQIEYKTTVLDHGDHISIMKEMFVDGKSKRQDLVHIPKDKLDEILGQYSNKMKELEEALEGIERGPEGQQW